MTDGAYPARRTTAVPQQRGALDDTAVNYLAARAEAAALAIAEREAAQRSDGIDQSSDAKSGVGSGGVAGPGGIGGADPIADMIRAEAAAGETGETGFGSGGAVGRYSGRRQGMSAPRKIALGLVGLALLGGVVGYIGWQQANPPIQGTVLSFTINGDSVTTTFEIDKTSNKSATCVLAVLSVSATVIGSATVQVPAGREKNVMSDTVEATAPPNTVQVQSCALDS